MKLSGRITLKDIAAALGEPLGTIKELCLSEKINIWSACKPVDSPLTRKLKMVDFAMADYGIDAYGCTTNHPDSLLALYIQKGGQWNYHRPGQLYKVWRMGDFNGYNTEAECPVALDVAIDEREVTHTGLAYLVTSLRLSPNGEIDLDRISTDGLGLDTAYLGFIYHRRTGPLVNVWQAVDTGLTFADLKAQGVGSNAVARFSLPATTTETEWEGLWCFCQDFDILVTGDDEAAMFIPDTLQQWSVVLAPYELFIDFIFFRDRINTYEFDKTSMRPSSIDLGGNALRTYVSTSYIPPSSTDRVAIAHFEFLYYEGSQIMFRDEREVVLQGLLPFEGDDDREMMFGIDDDAGRFADLTSLYGTNVDRVVITGYIRARSASIDVTSENINPVTIYV